MAAKKRRKSKKGTTKRRRKSTARASTAKRSVKRVSLTMAQLRALSGKKRGKGRKKAASRSRARDDYFDEGMRGRFSGGHGASALERKLLAEVNSAVRKAEALTDKQNEATERQAEIDRLNEYKKLAGSQLSALRAKRSAKIAEREAKFRYEIAAHKNRVREALNAMKADKDVSIAAIEMAKDALLSIKDMEKAAKS